MSGTKPRKGLRGRLAARADAVALANAEAEREERLRERVTQQVLAQWAEGRAARRSRQELVFAGEAGEASSNYRPARVPFGIDLAAAWSWRLLVICGATALLLYLLKFFVVVMLPLVVALFICALAIPGVDLLERVIPRKIAALLVEVAGIALVGVLLSIVGTQVATGVTDLSVKVVNGLEEVRHWLQTGPLNASDSQINDYIGKAQEFVREQGGDLATRLTEVGTAVGHIVAGLFIILFGTYFFMADGKLIWAWLVRIFPRNARHQVDSSGRVAWRSLTQFVRATVLVAATDAIAIAIWAAALGVPLVGAIAILVFLGAFVPLIGATLSGAVAVLVALVANGPLTAVLMLVGVIVVQQLEAHLLQPFLMGRFVSVHPLGVIVAIACGVIVAGVAGALIAVPLAAALNAVVQHLAEYTDVGDSPGDADDRDPPGEEADRDESASPLETAGAAAQGSGGESQTQADRLGSSEETDRDS